MTCFSIATGRVYKNHIQKGKKQKGDDDKLLPTPSYEQSSAELGLSARPSDNEEFNLSKYRDELPDNQAHFFYWEEDVKEFIKRLKEEIDKGFMHEIGKSYVFEIIDKLAGSSLQSNGDDLK